MKKKNLLLLVILISVLGTIGTIFVIQSASIRQVNTLLIDVKVTNSSIVGMNVDPDGLHFGSLRPGDGSTRMIELKDIKEDSVVTVSITGNISGWVGGQSKYRLDAGTSRNISYSVNIPTGAKAGYYSGQIMFVFRKA